MRIFPKEQLNRISPKIIEEFYGRKPTRKPASGVEREVREGAKPEDKLVDDA